VRRSAAPVPSPRISVVLATYEEPALLDATLHALSEQGSPQAFEVVIADDGSGDSIEAVVERWSSRLSIQHVWQQDEGFRKAKALNRAALSATGDYLVFIDADCVPRRDFVKSVGRAARPGWFLTTKRVDLSEEFTARVLREQVPIWRWSAGEWLVRAPRELGRPGYLVPGRDRRRPWRPSLPDFVPPHAAYCLIGVGRESFVEVNGYDARCVRSDDGEDQDLAIRLRRSGLRCGWPGPDATVLHLWHPVRSDKSPELEPLFRETERSRHVEAVVGLRELTDEVRQSSAKRAASSSSSNGPE
jgi:glycosyltransferase involved in cell wall biosynthesis